MRAGGTRARPARARGYARSGGTRPRGGTRARGYALSGVRALGVRAIVSGDRGPALRAQQSSHLSRSARPRVGFFGGAGCPFNCETQPAPPKKLRAKAAEARAATCDPHEAQITLLRRSVSAATPSVSRRRHQSRGGAISLAAAPSVARRRHGSPRRRHQSRGDAISLAAAPSVSRRRHQSRGGAISLAATPSVARRRPSVSRRRHQSRGDAISLGATHHSRGEASVARRRHQSRGGAISCTTSGANHLRRRAIERVPRGSAERNPVSPSRSPSPSLNTPVRTGTRTASSRSGPPAGTRSRSASRPGSR